LAENHQSVAAGQHCEALRLTTQVDLVRRAEFEEVGRIEVRVGGQARYIGACDRHDVMAAAVRATVTAKGHAFQSAPVSASSESRLRAGPIFALE
jgi:hypothetical protein